MKRFGVVGGKLNMDYLHILDKEWTLSIIEMETSEIRTYTIKRLACGFDTPSLPALIEKIENAKSWEEIEALNQNI